MTNTWTSIREVVAEILDRDPAELSATAYLIRDLEAESIDLLEIGVGVQHRLGVAVDEDRLFLKNLRTLLVQAELTGSAPEMLLAKAYPHLSAERQLALLTDVAAGPVLQLRDLVAYVDWARGAHSFPE